MCIFVAWRDERWFERQETMLNARQRPERSSRWFSWSASRVILILDRDAQAGKRPASEQLTCPGGRKTAPAHLQDYTLTAPAIFGRKNTEDILYGIERLECHLLSLGGRSPSGTSRFPESDGITMHCYRPERAASHHLRASASDNGGSKYLHLDRNADDGEQSQCPALM